MTLALYESFFCKNLRLQRIVLHDEDLQVHVHFIVHGSRFTVHGSRFSARIQQPTNKTTTTTCFAFHNIYSLNSNNVCTKESDNGYNVDIIGFFCTQELLTVSQIKIIYIYIPNSPTVGDFSPTITEWRTRVGELGISGIYLVLLRFLYILD